MQAGSRLRVSAVARAVPSEGAARAREDRTINQALRIIEQRLRGQGPSLSEVATCGAFFRLRLGREEREHFEAAFLNTRHQLIAVERLFSGTVDGAEVHPRILVQRALALNASAILLALLLGSLWIWYRDTGSLAIDSVRSVRSVMHYLVTIMFSQTLGTALGDWTAKTAGLGFSGGALIFSALLIAIAAAWRWTRISRTTLFWSAFILTRPLGAVVGDLLDKPLAEGGLALSRYTASLVILAVIALLIHFVPQRAARHAH